MKNKSRRLLKQCAAAGLVCLLSFSAFSLPVSADEPYDVYNYNYLGEAVPSQAGYLAERSVSGLDLGTTALNAPSDLFKDKDDFFYSLLIPAITGSSRSTVNLQKSLRSSHPSK